MTTPKPIVFKHRDRVRHTDGRVAVVVGDHQDHTWCSVLPEVGPIACVRWSAVDLELLTRMTPAAYTEWLDCRG